MAILQTSVPISISDLKTHFGDTGDSSLSEFYRDKDGIVPDNNVNQNCGPNNNGIPTIPPISLTDFLGATNEKYKLTAVPGDLDEGESQTVTLHTKNVPQNTAIPFTITADLYSDAGVDSNGIPQAYDETFIITLYTDNSRTVEIGGPEGQVDFLIEDTSLSWYQNIENATDTTYPEYEISGQDTMSVTANEQGYTTQDYYVIVACDNAFEVKTNNNAPTNYNVTMITPRSGDKHTGTLKYGNAPASWINAGNDYGRYITTSTNSTDSVNQNWTFAQGDSFTPATASWANNTTNPSLSLSRSAKFPQLTTVGTHVITIKEKVKFNCESLVSGDDRELGQQDTNSSGESGTHWCIIKTTHILDVGEWSA